MDNRRLSDRIKSKQREMLEQKYGKRTDISSEEISKVEHEAAIRVQQEIKDERKRGS